MPGPTSLKNIKYKTEPVEAPDASEFILNGSLYTPGGNTIVSISAEGLKWIARHSDFNVDLQCRNGIIPSYRAICGKCKEYMELDRETVHFLSLGRTDLYSGVYEFLVKHRHGVENKVDIKELVGRKFRDVS